MNLSTETIRELKESAYEAGYRDGMEAAIRWLAIFSDGFQHVGVSRQPLQEVIDRVRAKPFEDLKTEGW